MNRERLNAKVNKKHLNDSIVYLLEALAGDRALQTQLRRYQSQPWLYRAGRYANLYDKSIIYPGSVRG